jgi:hypothetical protein
MAANTSAGTRKRIPKSSPIKLTASIAQGMAISSLKAHQSRVALIHKVMRAGSPHAECGTTTAAMHRSPDSSAPTVVLATAARD